MRFLPIPIALILLLASFNSKGQAFWEIGTNASITNSSIPNATASPYFGGYLGVQYRFNILKDSSLNITPQVLLSRFGYRTEPQGGIASRYNIDNVGIRISLEYKINQRFRVETGGQLLQNMLNTAQPVKGGSKRNMGMDQPLYFLLHAGSAFQISPYWTVVGRYVHMLEPVSNTGTLVNANGTLQKGLPVRIYTVELGVRFSFSRWIDKRIAQ